LSNEAKCGGGRGFESHGLLCNRRWYLFLPVANLAHFPCISAATWGLSGDLASKFVCPGSDGTFSNVTTKSIDPSGLPWIADRGTNIYRWLNYFPAAVMWRCHFVELDQPWGVTLLGMED
jgi:hypothetical protein